MSVSFKRKYLPQKSIISYKLWNNPTFKRDFLYRQKIEWILHIKCFHESKARNKNMTPSCNLCNFWKMRWHINIYISTMEGFQSAVNSINSLPPLNSQQSSLKLRAILFTHRWRTIAPAFISLTLLDSAETWICTCLAQAWTRDLNNKHLFCTFYIIHMDFLKLACCSIYTCFFFLSLCLSSTAYVTTGSYDLQLGKL